MTRVSLSKLTLDDVNTLALPEFVQLLGGLFEHSSWIVEQTATRRPFVSREDFLESCFHIVRASSSSQQLALIRAHPDLTGRLAQQGKLTIASQQEQAAAGLTELTSEKIAQIEQFNAAYLKKFGFPFVICARLNNVSTILAALAHRLTLEPEGEKATALQEIEKIARLRLQQIWPE